MERTKREMLLKVPEVTLIFGTACHCQQQATQDP
jgi:hypothetical protein